MNSSTEKNQISKNLKRLKEIVSWFESQKDIEVEEGLKKVKEGAQIIKSLKSKMKEIENEFIEIKKTIEDEN
jgi:exonuclease VII small subunit